MFEKYRAERRDRKELARIAGVQELYPLYPFNDLTDEDVMSQASGYIHDRLVEVSDMDAARDECEYAMRNPFTPDRRLTFGDARIWSALHRQLEIDMPWPAEFDTLLEPKGRMDLSSTVQVLPIIE